VSDQRTTVDLEADIERQRDHLAETVDQLSRKLDVKAQARARMSRLQGRLQDRATTESGKPRPEVVAGAVLLVGLVSVLVWWRRR
jgi:Protein of unknown function (DUF3618)